MIRRALLAIALVLPLAAHAQTVMPGTGGFLRLFSNDTSVGNGADTTTDTLHSFTLAAGQLANVGDTIHIKTGGALGATTDSKTVAVSFGGQTVAAGSFSTATITGWWADVIVTKTGASTQSYVSTLTANTSGSPKTASGTLAITDTATIAILVTGRNATTSTAGSITAQLSTVDYEH